MNRAIGLLVSAIFVISLLLSGCGRAAKQEGVYVKCPDWPEDWDTVAYVILDGRKYCNIGADSPRKDLIGEFIADVDGKKVKTNSTVGGKLYSIKGYDERYRIAHVQGNDFEDADILDSYDDEYISTLEDVLDIFHYEPADERMEDFLSAAEDSVCMELERDPWQNYDSELYRYDVEQKGDIKDCIFIYPNGYLQIPNIHNSDRTDIYFKVSEEVMKEYPEFFEEK